MRGGLEGWSDDGGLQEMERIKREAEVINTPQRAHRADLLTYLLNELISKEKYSKLIRQIEQITGQKAVALHYDTAPSSSSSSPSSSSSSSSITVACREIEYRNEPHISSAMGRTTSGSN